MFEKITKIFEKIKGKNAAKIGLIASGCALLAFVALLILIKCFFSYSLIENNLSDFLGLKIELIKPKTTLDYRFNINSKAEYINIYNENKTKKFISIKNPELTFKPASFVFKKANFKKINAQNIQINILRDETGRIDLITSLKRKNFDFLNNKNITLTRLNSEINKINITFEDNYKIKSTTEIELLNTDIDISKRNKHFYFAQKGTIKTNVNQSKQTANLSLNIHSKYPINTINSDNLAFNVKLDNINLYIFNDIVKNYISKDISTFSGNAALNLNTIENNNNHYHNLNINIKNPALKLANGRTISPYKEDIKLNAQFRLDKNHADIRSLTLTSNDLSLISFGEISKPFSKKPDINFSAKITNTQINNFVYFLPDNLIFYRPQGIPALKNSNLHGIVNGNINLKLFPLKITGNIKTSDIHIPNYPKSSRPNNVNTIFTGNKAKIFTRVYTPDDEYVEIDGTSNLDDSLYGKYSVKSTSKIDLAYARLYLVPIQQIIGFNIGPVPIMKISGYGNIDIKTQGTLEDAQIFGNFEAHNASAEIEGLAAKLTNGTCKLAFSDRDLFFKEIKGKLEGSDFLLTGVGNTKGEVNLNTKIENAKTSSILKIFKNSSISKPYTGLIKNIAATSGAFSAQINLNGTIQDYEDSTFLEKLSLKGTIDLKNNKVIFNNNLAINSLSGFLNFGDKQNSMFEFKINDSPLRINFASKTPLDKISKGANFDFKSEIHSNSVQFQDLFKEIKKVPFIKNDIKKALSSLDDINFYTKFNIKSQGTASLNKIDLKNIKNQGYITGLNHPDIKDVVFNSGTIKIENNKILFDNFSITALKGDIKAKGSINNIMSQKPLGDLNIVLKEVSLEKLNKIFPDIKITKSKINRGEIAFKNDNLRLNSVSIDHNSMPLFLNANVKNIYKTANLEANFSTIINEQTVDSVINPYLTYPVKIKGEIPIRGNFKGQNQSYIADLNITIPKNSDISFSGANLGDINHKREFQTKVELKNKIITVHNFRLIKYIVNQNSKINPITAFQAAGRIIQKNGEMFYDNFKIVTNNPVNVRILNLIFKKSLLKNGNFDCNIGINGNVKTPKITGKIFLQDLDIPLYNTQINTIKVNISDNFIDSDIQASNKESSDVQVNLRAVNNLKTPYIINNINISSNNLNISDILNSLAVKNQKTDVTAISEILIKPDDVIIKNGSFDFKDVRYEKITAQNLRGNFNYKDQIFNLKDVYFNIAQGGISANGMYNLKTTKLNLSAKMENCDSNILTKQFLNLSDQIFGRINGKMELSVKNLDTPQGIDSLKSNIDFSINNGKMPKLGSLEYLLRAGNLIKNGLLGLSLNNLIQVLTPYKTGEFEQISGSLSINNAEIEKLEILSKGKNLSLYLNGTYSILESFADIKIYGKLSQNISNALGAVGNASINQFINSITPKKNADEKNSIELIEKLQKIPSIEIENPQPRFFRAKVLGDINKDNYIKNFNWI